MNGQHVVTSGRSRLKVSGPESILTLRGQLLGRKVALICCSESHEDAIDLTRRNSIPETETGWTEPAHNKGRGLDLSKATAVKHDVTRKNARKWAKNIMTDEENSDDSEEEDVGAWFVFRQHEESSAPDARGTAYVLPSAIGLSSKHMFGEDTTIYQWADLDAQARAFNNRRLSGEGVPAAEHIALIAERKKRCLNQGFELFDDWIIRQARSTAVRFNVVLEATVVPSEVDLHRDAGAVPLAAAHECLRSIELDSDEDSDDDDDPGDGTGSFLEYLHHRLRACLRPEQLHCVDPREMGCDPDAVNDDSFQSLLASPLPRDVEDVELEEAGANLAVPPINVHSSPVLKPAVMRRQRGQWRRSRSGRLPQTLPSWEAFFGTAAEILYHTPVVKADYAPFLAKCVGGPDALLRFFEALYFGTIDEALATLRLDESTRPFARLRSLAYRAKPGAPLMRRPDDQGLVPCRAAPLSAYLKARCPGAPRTWVSGLADGLQRLGAGAVVEAARRWYLDSATKLLEDPKANDGSGDYFLAWLRECHRALYDDIDTDDPEELVRKDWVESQEHPGSKGHRHRLRDLRIPSFRAAFKELTGPGADFAVTGAAATRRQRVLAKILVDAFQLRLVDLAAVLRVAAIVAGAGAAADDGAAPVVVVIYAGADHTKSIADFWQAQGFTSKGLDRDGRVGKSKWEDNESRCLDLPSYLHDLSSLFHGEWPVDAKVGPLGDLPQPGGAASASPAGEASGSRKRKRSAAKLEIVKRFRREGSLSRRLSTPQWRRFLMRLARAAQR